MLSQIPKWIRIVLIGIIFSVLMHSNITVFYPWLLSMGVIFPIAVMLLGITNVLIAMFTAFALTDTINS